VEIIFGRRVRCDTPGTFRTAIDRPVIDPDDKGVVVNIFYKHSRVKQYLKDGRAMRIETVINCPRPGLQRPPAQPRRTTGQGRAINGRILNAERAGQATVLASPAFERIAHPSVTADGRRTSALRFGDPRVMALAGALCSTLLAATGITNKSLRALMTGLLAAPSSPGQMTYDLRRLRLAGLIHRIDHTNRYVLNPRRHPLRRLLHQAAQPAAAPAHGRRPAPPAPSPLRQALHAIDQHVDDYITHARLGKPRENLTQTSRS
jgi:hypothetical protein